MKKKLSPEQIQYKIPRVANRFGAVYKKPIFYLAAIAVFCIVAAVTVGYNMMYFTTVNNDKIFINCRIFYESREYSERYSPLFVRSRLARGYDIYFTRYDKNFAGERFGGYFDNTALEGEYAGKKSCDDMDVMFYIVNNTYGKILKRITYSEVELAPTAEVQFYDLMYYIRWALDK